jgi:cob(I)alamin adenosyltransferase
MKIYTKKGDKGQTGLIGGIRVSKNDLRINAYGTVDELNAHVGMLRDLVDNNELKHNLLEIQDRLFTAGSLLAVGEKGTKMKLPELHKADIECLESWIDKMDTYLPPMRTFVLPGGHVTVSTCHIVRTVCRRAERLIVELSNQLEDAEVIVAYFNRLSDYFFTLSRKLSMDLKAEETPWIPKS